MYVSAIYSMTFFKAYSVESSPKMMSMCVSAPVFSFFTTLYRLFFCTSTDNVLLISTENSLSILTRGEIKKPGFSLVHL